MADRSYESKLKKGEMMIEALKRNWWVLVIRGVCGIIFGIIAFAYPGLALATLVLLFGAWVLIDGVFRIVGATAGRSSDPDWGFHLIVGILGVVIGFITFSAPAITALVLIIYMAAWSAVRRVLFVFRQPQVGRVAWRFACREYDVVRSIGRLVYGVGL